LPVVLYHIDLTGDKFEAIDKISEALDKKEANLFIDISWIFDNNLLKYAIDKLGIDRIMFGTDTPIAEMGKVKNYSDYIKNIASVINEYFEEKNNPQMIDKAIDNIFYNNAKNLFIKQKTLDLVA
jgi:predicted TIM-barrel fold metal-dependent hydrolase